MNYSYPYGLFNQTLIKQQTSYEQQMHEYDQQQRKAVYDATKAADDFLDALNKIHPAYQDLAIEAILSTIFEKMRIGR